MNKIVRERYPVSRLPADIQGEVGDAEYVDLIIDVNAPAPSREKLMQLLEEVRRRPPIGDDPVERIRKLRDEWEH